MQRGTLKDDFSEGWKRFKKEAGVVFLGDAIREGADAAQEKGVITFKPDKPEVCTLSLSSSKSCQSQICLLLEICRAEFRSKYLIILAKIPSMLYRMTVVRIRLQGMYLQN